MTSGATTNTLVQLVPQHIWTRTPVWTAHHLVITHRNGRRIPRNSKVCQLHAAVLIREDIRPFDVAMDDTLVVEIHKTLQNLRDIHPNECLRELAESLANIMKRAILAESTGTFSKTSICAFDLPPYALQDYVQELARLLETLVLDDIWMLCKLFEQGVDA